jgi:hypothetical protein
MQPARSSPGIDLVGQRPEPAQVRHAFHADEGEADPSEHGEPESGRTSRSNARPHFSVKFLAVCISGTTYEVDHTVLISMATLTL